jgi:telomerase reverse transcriptase
MSGSSSPVKRHAVPGQGAAARAHTKGPKQNRQPLSPNAVIFCRQRMLYARPHLNANGGITFGLPNRES